MKKFIIIFTIVAVSLVVFNATKIDLKHPLEGESAVAVISILALLCGIILLQILRLSKRVAKELKKKTNV